MKNKNKSEKILDMCTGIPELMGPKDVQLASKSGPARVDDLVTLGTGATAFAIKRVNDGKGMGLGTGVHEAR